MTRAWSAVPLLAVASVATACGSLELRPDEATDPDWTAVAGHAFEWCGDDVRLTCDGRASSVANDFPVEGNVLNESAVAVTVTIRRVVPDGPVVVGWRRTSTLGSTPVAIVDGEPFAVPTGDWLTGPAEHIRLRADREWSTEQPMRTGDTVSYDIEITSGARTTVCRMRMAVARRWSDTFDEWWEPIVFIPLIPVAIVVLPFAYALSYIVYGHGIH